jgi:hypothetical protein
MGTAQSGEGCTNHQSYRQHIIPSSIPSQSLQINRASALDYTSFGFCREKPPSFSLQTKAFPRLCDAGSAPGKTIAWSFLKPILNIPKWRGTSRKKSSFCFASYPSAMRDWQQVPPGSPVKRTQLFSFYCRYFLSIAELQGGQ